MNTTQNTQQREIILTGDRATGPLHLGHYVGSLQQRVALQSQHDQTILVADMQGLTCLLYTSPSPRDRQKSRMPSSA